MKLEEKEKLFQKPGKDYIGVGCGALVVNDKNQVLLLRRTDKSQGGMKGLWSRPGGAVEFGEIVEQAIKRELKEELDIDVELFGKNQFFEHVWEEDGIKRHWIGCGCFAKIIKGEPKNLEPEKHDKLEWFDLDNLPENLASYTKEGIKEFKKWIK